MCGAYQYFAPRSEYQPQLPPPAEIKTGILIHFDGANEPINPGGTSACGWLIYRDGIEIQREHRIVQKGGNSTHNQAEWCGLGFALKAVNDLGLDGPIVIRGDSQLVIFQLTRKWKCKIERLRLYRNRCFELLAGKQWTAEWVPCEMNAEADAETAKCYPPEMLTCREMANGRAITTK